MAQRTRISPSSASAPAPGEKAVTARRPARYASRRAGSKVHAAGTVGASRANPQGEDRLHHRPRLRRAVADGAAHPRGDGRRAPQFLARNARGAREAPRDRPRRRRRVRQADRHPAGSLRPQDPLRQVRRRHARARRRHGGHPRRGAARARAERRAPSSRSRRRARSRSNTKGSPKICTRATSFCSTTGASR